MTLAGTPPTKVYGGTSCETTAPAAITAPSPIVTLRKIITFGPIHALFPMVTGPTCSALQAK